MDYSITEDQALAAILSQNEYFQANHQFLGHDQVAIHHHRKSYSTTMDDYLLETIEENICVTLAGSVILTSEVITHVVDGQICDIEIVASWNSLLHKEYVRISSEVQLLGIIHQLGEYYGLQARIKLFPGLLVVHIGEKVSSQEVVRPMPAEAVLDPMEIAA